MEPLEVEATKSAAKAVIRFATLRKEGHGQDFGLFSSCRPHSWQPLWCCKVNFCVFQINFWNFFGQNWNSTVYFENINSERNYNLDNFCWEIFVKLKGDAQLGCKQTLTIFFDFVIFWDFMQDSEFCPKLDETRTTGIIVSNLDSRSGWVWFFAKKKSRVCFSFWREKYVNFLVNSTNFKQCLIIVGLIHTLCLCKSHFFVHGNLPN